MKAQFKKPLTLPSLNEKAHQYAIRSFQIADKGCYTGKKLLIDDGYGDYNMKLFRLKERKKYMKYISTAFTPAVNQLLLFYTDNPREKKIATQHNEQIQRIINEPKEVYLEQIKRQREQQQERRVQQQRKSQFAKGVDRQIREYKQQLSFNYLPNHQSDTWFKVLDRSPHYLPTPFSFHTSSTSSPQSVPKKVKKYGHVFLSDDKTYRTLTKRR